MTLAPAPAILLLTAVACSGCAHARRVAPGFNVSSETSDYSPTARLAVSFPLSMAASLDSIVVLIDSAILTAPGLRSADTLPVMRNLYISALVATSADGSHVSGRPAPPWLELASGDSALVVEGLRLGEVRHVRHIRLSIARPHSLDPTRAWLIFRISGAAITKEVQLADGRVVAPKSVAGGIRVFACADWTLAGYLDRRRAKALARAYTAAC